MESQVLAERGYGGVSFQVRKANQSLLDPCVSDPLTMFLARRSGYTSNTLGSWLPIEIEWSTWAKLNRQERKRLSCI